MQRKDRDTHQAACRIRVLSRHLDSASNATSSGRCISGKVVDFHRSSTNRRSLLWASMVSSSAIDLVSGRDEDTHLPIFVLLPSLPLSEERFHIFEPRYRLLLKHCLDRKGPAGHVGEFGMCWPVQGGDYSDVGTLLRIQEHTLLSDGRFDIKCVGVRRFHVLNNGNVSDLEVSTNSMASYNCANIEWFDDVGEDIQADRELTSNDESKLADEARNQLVKLHDTLLRAYPLPEAKDLLSRMHDPDLYNDIVSSLDASKSVNVVIDTPREDSQFSWWLLSRLVPLPPDMKAELILTQSISQRLAHAIVLLENLSATFIDLVPCTMELVCDR